MLVLVTYMLLVNSNSIVQLYAYDTNSHTIRVRYEIRVWYTTGLPFSFIMIYCLMLAILDCKNKMISGSGNVIYITIDNVINTNR